MRNILILSLLFTIVNSFAQTNPIPNWDNQLYIGNKITAGKNDWKFSGELQVRLKNSTKSLNYYFVEGVVSYLISKDWEIVPDFRFSIKPDKTEFRPGFGIVYKTMKNNFQFVNQLKWQTDFDTEGNSENAMRYAIFLNYMIHKKYIPNFVAGALYRWSDNDNFLQFVRFGPGLAFVFDVKHVLNINYLLSVKNYDGDWAWAGIPAIQLVININKDYKYVPAKYFNF